MTGVLMFSVGEKAESFSASQLWPPVGLAPSSS